MPRIRDKIQEEYFEWMCEMVGANVNCEGDYSFNKLLRHLHQIEFTYIVPKDENRAKAGIGLRRRFSLHTNQEIKDYLDGPCSVLELIVSIAKKCEEDIMDNTEYGDRTSQWFWGMIANLGLNGMVDCKYDEDFVDEKIRIFLNREYEPNGRGGLFYIRGCDKDLRKVAIYHQMCWYLDTIV